MLPQTTFALHTHFLHHAARSRIIQKIIGVNAVQADDVKSESYDCADGFSVKATIPIGLADPVTQFRPRVYWLNAKTNTTN